MNAPTVSPLVDAELAEILSTHQAQFFGRLARYAASHHLGAAEIAAELGAGVDVVRAWERWAAEGPTCTCTRHDGAVVRSFDCPVHGDVVYRCPVRVRLMGE